MSQRKVLIDGTKPLAQQENDLNGSEGATLSRTTAYDRAGGSSTHQNQATLTLADDDFHQLYLAAVACGASTAQTILQQKNQGRELVFTCTAWVSSAQMTVMGFRQP